MSFMGKQGAQSHQEDAGNRLDVNRLVNDTICDRLQRALRTNSRTSSSSGSLQVLTMLMQGVANGWMRVIHVSGLAKIPNKRFRIPDVWPPCCIWRRPERGALQSVSGPARQRAR